MSTSVIYVNVILDVYLPMLKKIELLVSIKDTRKKVVGL